MSLPLKLATARVALSERTPYLSTALWAVTFHEVPELSKKALGPLGIDDKWRIYYDPKKVEEMEFQELMGTLLHEINHVLREHSARRGSRDAMIEAGGSVGLLWNLATDLSINQGIRPHFKLPDWVVQPSQFKLPEGHTEEWYYDALLKQSKDWPKSKCNCGSGADGQRREWEHPDAGGGPPKEGQGEQEEDSGVSQTQADMIRREVAKEIQASPPGTVSADLQRWADDTLAPKVPWQTLLFRYLKRGGQVTAGKMDYTYQRPSRRRLPGVIMPSLISRQPKVVVVSDTSGSMGTDLLAQSLAEIKGISKSAGFETTVLFVDAEVCSKTSAKKAASQMRGGGGTDMGVGIEAAERLKPRPDVCVVLTDGYTPWPQAKPGVEVIVCLMTQDAKAPSWAKEVRICLT